MKCTNCGAEIADKALICYRCGTATTEAKYQPADIRAGRSRSSLVWIVLAILALAALALGAFIITAGHSHYGGPSPHSHSRGPYPLDSSASADATSAGRVR